MEKTLNRENQEMTKTLLDLYKKEKRHFCIAKKYERDAWTLKAFSWGQELEKKEPLLKENPRRWVMFPIQFPSIWEFYKKHEASRALPMEPGLGLKKKWSKSRRGWSKRSELSLVSRLRRELSLDTATAS